MRRLVVNTFLTLDGVMQAPGGPDEDRSGGFEYGGWSVPYWDSVMEEAMGEHMGEQFDLLLGRGTYEIFAAHWPHSDEPEADILNSARKHVASTTLTSLEWSNAELLKGDLPRAVAALKQEDGPELQVHGSPGLLQTLLSTDLIDQLNLMIFPVVVGPGKRLFGTGTIGRSFDVVRSRTSTTGVFIACYVPAGPPRIGSFGTDEAES